MPKRYTAWSAALAVVAVTAILVVLDIADGSVHRYWSRHSFTASVLAGLLVLLLTVLIVDRVNRSRHVRDQSAPSPPRRRSSSLRPSASQTLSRPSPTEVHEEASEMRYERSGPDRWSSLEDVSKPPRAPEAKRRDDAVAQLRAAAAPLLAALTPDERAAVSSDVPSAGS